MSTTYTTLLLPHDHAVLVSILVTQQIARPRADKNYPSTRSSVHNQHMHKQAWALQALCKRCKRCKRCVKTSCKLASTDRQQYVLPQGRSCNLVAPLLHYQLGGAERREEIGLTDNCSYRYPWRLMPSLVMVMLGCSWAKAHQITALSVGVYWCNA